jgi:hypothetical protein
MGEPHKRTAAPGMGGGSGKVEAASVDASRVKPTDGKNQLVAAIDASRGHQVRVVLATWRGQVSVQLRPYSATVPDVFMPCGAGITLPIEKLPELLEALHTIEARKAGP